MSRIEKSDKAFSLMDRNRDNSISVDEFIKVTQIFGPKNFGPTETLATLSFLTSLSQGDLECAFMYLRQPS